MARAATRAVRSDGAQTRHDILYTAARIATVRGIDQLSVGELAAAVGISKSGLYAHFGSKEELQLATIAAAGEIFEAEVLAPARRVPQGRDGLIALSEAFFDHLRNRVFPGGCFFDAVAADVHARPGPVKDAIGAFQVAWRDLVHEHLRAAQEAGDLPASEDIEQATFDVIAFHALAHTLFSFTGDDAVLDRAANAVRVRLNAD